MSAAAAVTSQQVSWWSVHEFVAERLALVKSWPRAGSPAWCLLDDHDPAKWAALLDDAQHHALRVETAQEGACQASRAIADSETWGEVGRQILVRRAFYTFRPWLKRVAS